eukprot:1304179-Rhodomonas_salina.1
MLQVRSLKELAPAKHPPFSERRGAHRTLTDWRAERKQREQRGRRRERERERDGSTCPQRRSSAACSMPGSSAPHVRTASR